MKDLKVVLWFGVPLVLTVAALLFVQSHYGHPTASPPAAERGGEGASRREPLHDGPVDRSRWPKEPRAGVGPSAKLTPVAPREPKDESSETPMLTVDELNRLLAVGDPASFQRIEWLLRHGLVEEPFRVADIMMEAMKKEGNNPAWMAKLLPLLKDDRVREKIAADLLTNLGDYQNRNALVAAIEVIGKVGKAGNVADLGRLARSHEMRDARAQAIYAIAAIGGESAARELTALLVEQKDVTLTLKAIEKMKGPEIVAELTTLTAKDQPEEVRLLGVQAIGRSATTREATEALLALRKEGGSLATAVAQQLRFVRGKEATEPFVDLIDKEENVIARAGMAEALGTNGSEPAREKLRGLLTDPDEAQTVRGASAKGLARSGDLAAVKPFTEILSNPSPERRLLENKVLRSVGTLAQRNPKAAEEMRKSVLPVLKKQLEESPEDPNTYWRHLAIVSLESTARGGPDRKTPMPFGNR